ncbi:MAG TPA: four helix bundle protein [Anaerolineae bacterium]|nr:four helix bundle protein [Anaerolineae bacterium]
MNKVFPTGHSKGQEICNRTRAYALRIIRLYQSLRKDEVGRVLGRQLLRSGTSIGANVEEAQAGQSPADFVAKMSIALKEARETRYWLLLLHDAEIFSSKLLLPLLAETEEIIKVLYTIIRNTKQNQRH